MVGRPVEARAHHLQPALVANFAVKVSLSDIAGLFVTLSLTVPDTGQTKAGAGEPPFLVIDTKFDQF